eukprot:sb/3469445/
MIPPRKRGSSTCESYRTPPSTAWHRTYCEKKTRSRSIQKAGSDPDLPGPDLPEPRFIGRIKFPRYGKIALFDPDTSGTPIYREKPFPPSIPVNRGPTININICLNRSDRIVAGIKTRGDGLSWGYVRVGGPCQAPNMPCRANRPRYPIFCRIITKTDLNILRAMLKTMTPKTDGYNSTTLARWRLRGAVRGTVEPNQTKSIQSRVDRGKTNHWGNSNHMLPVFHLVKLS